GAVVRAEQVSVGVGTGELALPGHDLAPGGAARDSVDRVGEVRAALLTDHGPRRQHGRMRGSATDPEGLRKRLRPPGRPERCRVLESARPGLDTRGGWIRRRA